MGDAAGTDEMISQFLAVTGSADPAKALSYLEMSHNNVETAVGLYMEHEQGPEGGQAAPAAAGMPEGIRAPDETRTMQLMDGGAGGGALFPPGMIPNDPSLQMMNAMMNEQLNQPTAFSSPGRSGSSSARDALNALVAQQEFVGMDDDDDDGDQGETKDEGEETENQGPARLSDMFSAPIHIMHRAGGFAGARAMAKDTKRWLLVNIQRDEEFASHALNRDVWRDELVENLVRSGFIFWQQMDSHPDGRTYIERYRVQSYPHLAILDPRTGRLLWSKEGWTQQNPISPETFAQLAMDFCSRNSFDRPPVAPKPGGQKVAVKRPMNEMSEAEQLEAAMRASMEASSPMDQDSDDEVECIDDDKEEEDDDSVVEVEDEKPSATPAEEPKPISMIDGLLAVTVGDEPATGSRIQLKMSDGKRVRKFSPSDTVRTIYAYVAQTNEEARGGREFVLMAGYPLRDLHLEMDSTIEEAKLKNEAVSVRWK